MPLPNFVQLSFLFTAHSVEQERVTRDIALRSHTLATEMQVEKQAAREGLEMQLSEEMMSEDGIERELITGPPVHEWNKMHHRIRKPYCLLVGAEHHHTCVGGGPCAIAWRQLTTHIYD
eukprot:199860-Prorocentrum_minimum.AAC.2